MKVEYRVNLVAGLLLRQGRYFGDWRYENVRKHRGGILMAGNPLALLIAPFFRHDFHVGVRRCERFVRWLTSAGVDVVIASSGYDDAEERLSDQVLLHQIRDPLLRFYRPQLNIGADESKEQRGTSLVEKAYHLGRNSAYYLLSPDPGILWAKMAVRRLTATELCQSAEWIISSSPPESSHIVACSLADRTGAKLIVDLRDGWLDEPLKPALQNSRFQQWREGREERTVLRRAERIFVTSSTWKKDLESRLPYTAAKIDLLYNCYPQETPDSDKAVSHPRDRIELLHVGRFTGSSNSRKANILMDTLVEGIQGMDSQGEITQIGSLLHEDRADLHDAAARLKPFGWTINTLPNIVHPDVLKKIPLADGLLLLSTSQAAIPSKMFEYIWAQRPVLCVSPKGSEVWDISATLPQFYLVDSNGTPGAARQTVRNFLSACKSGDFPSAKPDIFTEECQRAVFLSSLKLQ